ncbi:hypothetical protein V8E36_006445 [Tilletia maclaganii]
MHSRYALADESFLPPPPPPPCWHPPTQRSITRTRNRTRSSTARPGVRPSSSTSLLRASARLALLEYALLICPSVVSLAGVIPSLDYTLRSLLCYVSTTPLQRRPPAAHHQPHHQYQACASVKHHECKVFCLRLVVVLGLCYDSNLINTFKTPSRPLQDSSRPSQTLSGYFGYHPARLLPEATELRRITPRTTELRRRQVRTRTNATKPRSRVDSDPAQHQQAAPLQGYVPKKQSS